MEEDSRLKYLKIALVSAGAFCAVGVYPLTIYWPSGWARHATPRGKMRTTTDKKQ